MSLEYRYESPKPKKWQIIPWARVADPVNNCYGDGELLLTAVERMLDTSRAYSVPGRWGTTGVTGHLLDSSCVNMTGGSFHANGTWQEVKDKCRRLFHTGMLTLYDRAPQWRQEHKIGMLEKVRLVGPFGDDDNSQCKAWDRLRALDGKRIRPLNHSHPGATHISFTGIGIHERYKDARRWSVGFYVQYPRERYGSGWALGFLCEDYGCHNGNPVFDFKRGKEETVTMWLTRVADFVESLVLTRERKEERAAAALKIRKWRRREA